MNYLASEFPWLMMLIPFSNPFITIIYAGIIGVISSLIIDIVDKNTKKRYKKIKENCLNGLSDKKERDYYFMQDNRLSISEKRDYIKKYNNRIFVESNCLRFSTVGPEYFYENIEVINDFGRIIVSGKSSKDLEYYIKTENVHNGDIDIKIGEDGSLKVDDSIVWEDIIQVKRNDIFGFVGVKKDGTVISSKSEINELLKAWNNILRIDICSTFIVGLTEQGRIVLIGEKNDKISESLLWENIVDVACSSGGKTIVVGLSEDGKIHIAGETKYDHSHLLNKKFIFTKEEKNVIEQAILHTQDLKEKYWLSWNDTNYILKNILQGDNKKGKDYVFIVKKDFKDYNSFLEGNKKSYNSFKKENEPKGNINDNILFKALDKGLEKFFTYTNNLESSGNYNGSDSDEYTIESSCGDKIIRDKFGNYVTTVDHTNSDGTYKGIDGNTYEKKD